MKLKYCTAAFLVLSISGAALADGNYTNENSSLHAAAIEATPEKKASIKLHPNPSTDGTIRVVSNTVGQINFYIFELDGTLRHQAVISEKEKHTVNGLTKGVYTYDVFYNDEGIEHGKLIVK